MKPTICGLAWKRNLTFQKQLRQCGYHRQEVIKRMCRTRPYSLERRTAGVQYFLDYIDFNASFQSSTQLSNRAAYTSLLHFPAVQHLVHHLWQAITVVVMFNGLYFHLGQTQSPRTTLPLKSNVFSQQIQVLLNHCVVLWITREEMDLIKYCFRFCSACWSTNCRTVLGPKSLLHCITAACKYLLETNSLVKSHFVLHVS